jgi:transglutaminase-like putative cysteine protease
MAARAYSIRACLIPVAALLACLPLAVSIPAAAREKEASLPQWALDAANTPTPANAGDASAAVLDDEYLITIDDQNRAVERERYVVRILKPQGREYSHCVAEYAPDARLDYFHAWTVSSTGQRFEAKDTDFRDEGDYGDADMQSDDRLRELNPPAGDPGSVVICETEVHLRPYMSSEEWQIQEPIPVVEESLELDLPARGHFAQSWSHYQPLKPEEVGPNHLRWEVKTVPALDLENMHATPSWEALAARMSVKWGNSAANGVDNQWRELGEWMDQLEAHRPDPTPEITAKAQELTAGAPDLYTKLDRITSYIQNNIRYFIVMRGIGGFQAHYAADIFRNRYGDCKDKTTLLISMLQAIGIRAYYLHVDSERGVINPAEPSTMGNHMITAIELPDGENDPRLMARVKIANGKTLLIFDPTDETTPVGIVRPQLQGAYGNLADGENSQVLQIPVLSPDSAGLDRTGAFTMTADGSISGDVTDVFSGFEAARERAFLKESSSKDVQDTLEQGLSTDLPGLTFKGYEFHQQDQLDKPISLNLHVSDANYARSAGSLLLLRPRVMGTDTHIAPELSEGKKRTFPIEIGHPARLHDAFDITLPAGYSVDEIPDPVNVDVDFASYRSSVTAKGNVLHYEREYVVRQVEIPASEADDLRKLEGAIVFDEKGAVVLKKQ